MAISHLCLSCGFDLAWVRARRDPHYALPLRVSLTLLWTAEDHKPPAQRLRVALKT